MTKLTSLRIVDSVTVAPTHIFAELCLGTIDLAVRPFVPNSVGRAIGVFARSIANQGPQVELLQLSRIHTILSLKLVESLL
jgi:hypothetical protein